MALHNAVDAPDADVLPLAPSDPALDGRDRLTAAVCIGVGAAFDFHAGLKPQAPRWMQRSGLEWLFRLYQEPGRLWRRYLRNNPLFVWHVILQSLRLTTYSLDGAATDGVATASSMSTERQRPA